MNTWVKMVRRFHKKFGQPVSDGPPAQATRRDLRSRLIREETNEVMIAMSDGDIVEIADGLCDLIYVCIGAALEYGIDLDPIMAEVQRSNMAKVGGAMRTDGKVLKPQNWKPPAIAELLNAQGWKG